MSIISWNCKGLGSPKTVRHLNDLVRRTQSTIIFLWKQNKLRLIWSSGGLALWWTKEVSVTILSKDRNFIDCRVANGIFGEGFLVTWVYGDPN